MKYGLVHYPKTVFQLALLSTLLWTTFSAFAIQEGTPEAQAVLKLVNTADLVLLDTDVGLDSRAATNIITHRAGADGVLNSNDDNPFDTIAELDSVSYVGVTALDKLLTFAMANGYSRIDVAATVESSHPYGNSASREFVVRNLDAANIQLHFDRLDLLAGDVLTLLDVYGNEITSYTNTGSRMDENSPIIPGNTVTLRLTTDTNLNNYGFTVDRYSYEPLSLSIPVVLFEESFPYTYSNYPYEQRIVFQGHDVFMTERTPLNRSVSQADLAHWQFTDAGFVKRSKVTPSVPATTIGIFNNHAVTGNMDAVFDVPSQQKVYLQTSGCCTTYAVQIESDNRGFVYVGAMEKPVQTGFNRNYVQIFNTRSFSGSWEHTLSSATAIPFPKSPSGSSSNRFYVDNHYLIANARRFFAIYNIQNPYAPYHLLTIDAGSYVYSHSLKPLLVNGHIIVPYVNTQANPDEYHLSSFDIKTGYEVGYLPMPEVVMAEGVYFIDGSTLYVAGKTKVYVIDASNPANLRLVDTITVTYGPTVSTISHLHKMGNRLYAVYKKPDFYTNGMTMRVIGLPDNYPNR